MIQYHAKYVVPHKPNESFLFVMRPVKENRYLEMVVVHVQEEIVLHVVIKGEL